MEPPPCDLDPELFNLTTAWYHWPLPEGHPCFHVYEYGWKAMHHGVGAVSSMEACGCPVCTERVGVLRAAEERMKPQPEPDPQPPKRTDAAPAAKHVRKLLAAGMTRHQIALAGGLDVTTVDRLLRAGTKQVFVDTAAAVLAVPAPGRRRTNGQRTVR